MTGILGFAVAQGPLYAGTLCECLAVLDAKKACFDANSGPVTAVSVNRFVPGNLLQCTIIAGGARLNLVADFIGNKTDPQNLNFNCQISVTGVGNACGPGTNIQNLSRKESSAWATLAAAECREAQ